MPSIERFARTHTQVAPGAFVLLDDGVAIFDTVAGTVSASTEAGPTWSTPVSQRFPHARFAPDDGGALVLGMSTTNAAEILWLSRDDGRLVASVPSREFRGLVRWAGAVTALIAVEPNGTDVVRYETPDVSSTISLPVHASSIEMSATRLIASFHAEGFVRAYELDGTLAWERRGQLLAIDGDDVVGRCEAEVWIQSGLRFARAGALLRPDAGYLAGLRTGLLYAFDPQSCELIGLDLTGAPRVLFTRAFAAPKKARRAPFRPTPAKDHVWVMGEDGQLMTIASTTGDTLLTGPKVTAPLAQHPLVDRGGERIAWAEGGTLFAFAVTDVVKKPSQKRPSPASASSATRSDEAKPSKSPLRVLGALPDDEAALAAMFDARFAELIDAGQLEVQVARVNRRSTKAAPYAIAFRWTGAAPVAGGEIGWWSLHLGEQRGFQPESMGLGEAIRPKASPKDLHWFEDHPHAGDHRFYVHDGAQLYGVHRAHWFPLAIDLERYRRFSLLTPGLLPCEVLADPLGCVSDDPAELRGFLTERKKLAQQLSRVAHAYFGQVDLHEIDAFLATVASEVLRVESSAEGPHRIEPGRARAQKTQRK